MGHLRRAVVAVALVGFALTGCSSSEGPNPEPAQVPGAATNGKLTIGIPFDQPGIGMKNGETYSGFDVETAKYVAKALGVPGGQHHLEGVRRGGPRGHAEQRRGRPGRVQLHDQR